MAIKTIFRDSASDFLAITEDFLLSQPILHNLILTILHARIDYPEPGRYWAAFEHDRVVGVVIQSPVTFPATLSPMSPAAAVALVNAIAAQGIRLNGINGEAATAAAFAGQWNETSNAPAVPFQANRLYELMHLAEAPRVPGRFRQASQNDRQLLVDWANAFDAEVGEHPADNQLRVGRWLAAGELWVWEDSRVVSMAVSRGAVAGVARIGGVYTPPGQRRHGYAAACVHALSLLLRQNGSRCVLYTDLANPTSNSIYRKIGYQAVAEVLRYRFG